MKIYKKTLTVAVSAISFVSAFASFSAMAALPALPLTITATTVESLVYPNSATFDATRCPADASAMAIGMTGGTGTLTVAIGPGPKLVSVPVSISASDCPTELFSFSYGKLIVTTPDGSMLTASYHGAFSQPVTPVITIDAGRSAFSINGGTGIFSGALGSGQLSGQATLGPVLNGNLQLKGTISFSASNFQQYYRLAQ